MPKKDLEEVALLLKRCSPAEKQIFLTEYDRYIETRVHVSPREFNRGQYVAFYVSSKPERWTFARVHKRGRKTLWVKEITTTGQHTGEEYRVPPRACIPCQIDLDGFVAYVTDFISGLCAALGMPPPTIIGVESSRLVGGEDEVVPITPAVKPPPPTITPKPAEKPKAKRRKGRWSA